MICMNFENTIEKDQFYELFEMSIYLKVYITSFVLFFFHQ